VSKLAQTATLNSP